MLSWQSDTQVYGEEPPQMDAFVLLVAGAVLYFFLEVWSQLDGTSLAFRLDRTRSPWTGSNREEQQSFDGTVIACSSVS